jgi:phosphinothricin acetyltransferase
VIRRAEESDAPALVRIYNQSMVPGIYATSQLTPDTELERRAWVRAHAEPHPAFVCEHASEGVVGWASLSPFSVRPRLSSIAEVSLYVDQRYRHKLIGAQLIIALLHAARERGFRSLVSLTFRKNTASLRGLEAVGFRPIALVPEVCLLREQWEDDIWLQKMLDVPEDPQLLRRIELLESRQMTPS